MSYPYVHGVIWDEKKQQIFPIRGPGVTRIGAVVSCPTGPVNVPTPVNDRAEAAAKFGAGEGTGPDAFDGLFSHGAVPVVVVNVWDPGGNAAHRTDVAAADIAMANGVVQLPHAYVVDVQVQNQGGGTTYTDGVDYTVDSAAGKIERIATGAIGANDTLKIAYGYPNESGLQDSDYVGAVDAVSGQHSGCSALLAGAGKTSLAGGIVVCPVKSATQAVGLALEAASDRLLATHLIDGPDTTVAAVEAYRDHFTSRRGYLLFPGGVHIPDPDGGADLMRSHSAYAAAAIAARDASSRPPGYSLSPTHAVLKGISGLARPVEYSLTDPAAESNQLNGAGIATAVNPAGAWILWGDRGTAAGEDAQSSLRYLNIARIADKLRLALIGAHLWAVSRNLRATYFSDVAARMNVFLDDQVAAGALLGGECEPAGQYNTRANLDRGHAYFRIEFAGAPPAETVVLLVDATSGRFLDDLAEAV